MSVTRRTKNGGAKGLRRKIRHIQRRIKDIRPALPAVHDAFIEDEKLLFATGGLTGQHGTWPANRPSTIKAKGHAMVLYGNPRHGWRLWRSCTVRTDPDHVFIRTQSTVEMGTKERKASLHARGRGRLPKRRPVDPTFGQRRRYVRIISHYIVEGIANAE